MDGRVSLIPVLAIALLFAGCAGNAGVAANPAQPNNSQGVNNVNAQPQPVAAKGDTVSVDYILKLEDGTVFDTSIQSVAQQANLTPRQSYSPLTFVAGVGEVIPGFDSAVIGMKVGDEKTVAIPPEQGYGFWNQTNVVDVPLDRIQNSSGLKLGSVLTLSNGDQGVVTGIANATNTTNATVTVDFNSRLAGHTLTFYIKMLDIQKV